MSILSRIFRAAALSSIGFALTTAAFADGLSATATYTSVADKNIPGFYDYSLALHNTGTTTIGTFWFAWIPAGDFLNPIPTNVTNPSGWTNKVLTTAQGTSIQWLSTTDLLQSGQTLTGFNFASSETPDQLLGTVPSGVGAGDPITTSFVYIGAPFKDPGFQLSATAATPEPESLVFMATGLIGVAGAGYRRFKISDGRK